MLLHAYAVRVGTKQVLCRLLVSGQKPSEMAENEVLLEMADYERGGVPTVKRWNPPIPDGLIVSYSSAGRRIPSLLRQRLKLLGVKPIAEAAPPGPSILHPVLVSVSRKYCRSNSRNFAFSADRSLGKYDDGISNCRLPTVFVMMARSI